MPDYDITKWQPYVDFDIGQVKEPPCKVCVHFKPELELAHHKSDKVLFMGVRICHADEMFQDFSCFKAKKE